MDMESVLSPILAAALLVFLSFDNLFWGTSFGFIASALLVVSVALPSPKPTERRDVYDRTTRGIRIYLGTRRLRGLLALSWTAAAISAMVIVNTVVIVRADLGLSDSAVGIALAGFGGGSMLAALVLPSLLDKFDDRRVMLAGAAFGTSSMAIAAGSFALLPITLWGLVVLWIGVGFGYSATLTPSVGY